jgi:hypothetical protein
MKFVILETKAMQGIWSERNDVNDEGSCSQVSLVAGQIQKGQHTEFLQLLKKPVVLF